jgi:hypothetical protein
MDGSVLAAVGDDRPFLREQPCECGQTPLLIDGVYLCLCPACLRYDAPAWDPMEEAARYVS